ncbi:MAG TPA: TetR/AcrR family transcriptional regulator [Trebonia sp.]|jgi:AcrR family transcriptional regulator
MSTDGTARAYETQRKAADRNHAAILEVAHDLLASSPTASMNEIAKQAQVGAGTLYRHFPTREDLILAVYRHDMQKLSDSVGELLKTRSPLDAFSTWFETLAAYIRIKHGLDQALHSAAIRSAIDDSYVPVAAAVARLLDACVADGSVRPGLDADDVLLLMGFLWRLPPGDDGREQGRRIMRIVFNGILRNPE